MLRDVVGFYQNARRDAGRNALSEKRGLKSAEMVERFRLGYSTGSCYRLAGQEPPRRRAGARARSGWASSAPAATSVCAFVVIPVMTSTARGPDVWAEDHDNLRAGTPYHLYLPGPHRGVWNEPAFIASKEIILCEALIDALTFWVAGYRNVTASYGVNGFTNDHRAAFERHGIERVYIAYDGDEAGNKAAVKLADELTQMGVECFRVEFPKGMDANEDARTTQPATKLFGLLLNRAAWMGKGARPAGRVAVPVLVPESIATPLTVAAPAAEEPAAKKKMIEEQAPRPEPIIEPPPAETRAAAKGKIIEESVPAPSPEPEPGPAPAPVASEPVQSPQEQERDFSLAAEAAPLAPMPPRASNAIEAPVETRGEDVVQRYGDREYRVRGLAKNTSSEVLRVNLRVLGVNMHGDMALHVDTLELTSARQRMTFSKLAAGELHVKEEIIGHDLSQLFLKLEMLRDEQIARALAPKETEFAMTGEEREAALELLRDPRLIARVLEDFARCGVVGEETNKTVSYLAAVSRLMDAPLAIIVQSGSAAGKTSLMDAVLAFLPEEQRVQYSAMTGQALFYLGETELKHKVLAVVEEEGAQRAAYALKLLQSEGELTIASTGKDPATGRLLTHQYRVEGPVMIFLTTTAVEMDEELFEPLHRAHGERRPGADQGHPSHPA